ncbi:tRNA (adenine(22)-N(1))-methyltransferase TrmK [Sporosarcina sp. 179-K 3D1 HS]|uniref:tRNA (adenine(22)-N(1))-methyltransferase n=1 Tax=Sporosarcina sp. 179-K 3D1 HS TaxID=3232169 RepID=UPI00399F85EE
MNTEHLSDRLASVASFVPTGTVVADIGSDHAYLPCYLVKSNKVSRAIAGEVVKGPYESAVRNVQREGLAESITVRMANGLDAVHEEDGVDVITIAGMGGPLIVSILENGKGKLASVSRIITQPNINAKVIREWAVSNGWFIVDEAILKEDGKIYEVLVLERGHAAYDELELLVGPFLLDRKTDVFMEKWTREVQEWERVLQSLEVAEETVMIQSKKAQLMRQIELVGKVLSK